MGYLLGYLHLHILHSKNLHNGKEILQEKESNACMLGSCQHLSRGLNGTVVHGMRNGMVYGINVCCLVWYCMVW